MGLGRLLYRQVSVRTLIASLSWVCISLVGDESPANSMHIGRYLVVPNIKLSPHSTSPFN